MDKNRFIIVPLKEEYCSKLEYGLDYSSYNKDEYMIWRLSEEEFHQLWENGVFKTINDRCNILIDDYENEVINSNMIDNVLDILQEINETTETINKFKKFVLIAKESMTMIELDF